MRPGWHPRASRRVVGHGAMLPPPRRASAEALTELSYRTRIVAGYVVREFVDAAGEVPFRRWLLRLDLVSRARVQARIKRFELGNLGDHKSVGDGVFQDIARARLYWAEVLAEDHDGEAE